MRAALVAVVRKAAAGGMKRADLEREWDQHTEPARDAEGREDHAAELWVRGIFAACLDEVYGRVN